MAGTAAGDRPVRRTLLVTDLAVRIVVNRAITTGVRERTQLPVDNAQLESDNGRFSQDGCVKQIEVTVAVAGRVRDEDLDPLAREDLMNLVRRWRDGASA